MFSNGGLNQFQFTLTCQDFNLSEQPASKAIIILSNLFI